MKTIKDLSRLKEQKNGPFGNAYTALIERLVDYRASKSDGQARIERELSEWDEAAQEIIQNDLENAYKQLRCVV